MRIDGPESGNFQDDTGRSFGGGGGGNLLGCLLPMVASRFGIVGVLVLLLGYCALTQMGGGGLVGGGGPVEQGSAGQSRLDPATRSFSLRVLGSTEQTWNRLMGGKYQPTTLVFYNQLDQSGCGAAQSAMGPFYCPTDRKIYLDTQFFNELSRRFQAPGDFAQAYVIAHEVGHHVQDLMGTLQSSQARQSNLSRAQGNAVQVGIELQADCYAGVWAANAKNPDGSPIMQQGDFEEGMRAAEAIGDDMLTKGQVSPDNFTHGTSAQRMSALRTGFTTGDPNQCKFAR